MTGKVDDYIRRVQLAIDGFERMENVSTWVVKEHLKESIVLLREQDQARKAEVESLQAKIHLLKTEHNRALNFSYQERQQRKYWDQQNEIIVAQQKQIADGRTIYDGALAEIARLKQALADAAQEPRK